MTTQNSRERVFHALHDIALATGGVLEPVALARLVVDRACELFEVRAVGVYVLDDAGQTLTPVYSSDAWETRPEPPIRLGEGAPGPVAPGAGRGLAEHPP